MLNLITFCVLIYFVAFLLFVIDGSNRTAISRRLAIYKCMLIDYEANIPIVVKGKRGEDYTYDFNGFNNYSMCFYLNNVGSTTLPSLVELLETKPLNHNFYYITAFWFPIEDRDSRIKCIKQAIFITETKLKRKLILNTH